MFSKVLIASKKKEDNTMKLEEEKKELTDLINLKNNRTHTNNISSEITERENLFTKVFYQVLDQEYKGEKIRTNQVIIYGIEQSVKRLYSKIELFHKERNYEINNIMK